MLRGQPVFREQHPHPADPSQPGSQLTVAANRPELVPSIVQEQEHPASVRAGGGKPVGGHPASGHLRHQHVVRHAAFAAMAEYLGRRDGWAVPSWARLPEREAWPWWFVTDLRGLHPRALVESPSSFRRRAVFITDGALDRA